MKKIFRLASLFAFSFFMSAAMTGCSSDPVVEEEQEGSGSTDTPGEEGEGDEELVYMTIEANSPGTKQGNNGSRTQIDENDHVLWKAGDAISVFYKSEGNYKFTTEKEGETAIFGGLGPGGKENYQAIYPYNATAKIDGTKGISSYFNTRQYVPPTGGFDPTACHSYATLEHKQSDPNGQYYSGQFKMLVSMIGLKFDLSGLNSKLSEIRISINEDTGEGTSHNHLAGAYTIDASNPDEPVMKFGKEISHYLYVTTNQPGISDFESNTEYLIATPVIPKPVKLVFTFRLDDGRICTKTPGTTFNLERASIQPMKLLALKDDDFKHAPELDITDEKSFVEWYQDETNEYKVVKLTQDLDLKDYTNLVTRKYSGLFDGNGHTIKNMTVSLSVDGDCAFIGNMNAGEVKDLTLENFTTTGEASHAGTIAAQIQNETKIVNCKVKGAKVSGSIVGGLVGVAKRSVIFACELSDIEVTGKSMTGGFVGNGGNDNKFVANYMSGKVIDDIMFTGGMLGYSGKGNQIVSCYSMAEIQSNSGGFTGTMIGNGIDDVTIISSYYAGPTSMEEENNKISKEELVAKTQEMNAAIAKSGYEYVDNTDPATKDALPLVLKENASSEE